MNKTCVLIRVYNRVEDLQYCIRIIRDTWTQNNYFIIVVFNGAEEGYVIDDDSLSRIDLFLSIKNNTGHFSGNSQLLLAGLPHIPDDCDFTVILEADTWIYGDDMITKYMAELNQLGAVWASAQFFRYILNLATDFAIVKTAFIKQNREIFYFHETPEYDVANYLRDNDHRFIYIKENMPVNLPRYIKTYPFAPTGRFFLFPRGKMATHHTEALKGGMTEKKFYFNLVSDSNYFDVPDLRPVRLTRFFLGVWVALTIFLPYKSWFINRKNL